MEWRRKSGVLAAGLVAAALAASASGAAGAAPGPNGGNVELERVDTLLTGATSGSPAQFRLVEERDRLRVNDLADELDYVGRMFRQATPGSPAQFRAREEADSLREGLRRLDPTWEEAG